MKGNFRLLFSDKLIRITILLSVVLIISQVILIAVFYSNLPPLIPFLNSQSWGAGRLYAPWVVLSIPAALVLVFVLNNSLGIAFYTKNTLISRILSFNALLFSLLAFLAFIQIIFLVF